MTIGEHELTSLNYMSANLLEGCGLPLTRYQEFLLSLQEQLPVICAGAYVDRDGVYHSYNEEDGANGEALNEYAILQYNHMSDIKNRVTEIFSRPSAEADIE